MADIPIIPFRHFEFALPSPDFSGRHSPAGCNWLVGADEASPFCIACRLCEIHCQVQHSQSKKIIKAFREEDPKAMARLVHPNIVQIYDLGEQDGIPYIAMEYVHGRDLKQLLAEGRRFRPAEAARIVADVAVALSIDGEELLRHEALTERTGPPPVAWIELRPGWHRVRLKVASPTSAAPVTLRLLPRPDRRGLCHGRNRG